MDRPEYLKEYHFDWEIFDVLVGGKSALDANSYLGQLETTEDVHKFLMGYGFDMSNPVQSAELFGNFQEAVQFIRRYFLKEGHEEGLDVKIPEKILMVHDVSELFLIATNKGNIKDMGPENIWAAIILKVMHTILHTDKDLRYQYFSTIQFQIFDRFYKYLHRDSEENLFLKNEDGSEMIPLADFQTKSKKSRDSIIIKLLHKTENVAEELFDRVGVRFVTNSVSDTLRVMKFLYKNYVISAHNIKPSRSQNSLVDMSKFKKLHFELEKAAIRNKMDESTYVEELEKLTQKTFPNSDNDKSNKHTLDDYRSIHFTCRQLIKYKNPLMNEFKAIKSLAKDAGESDLTKRILAMDTSSISRVVRFFYPFEVQITDEKSYVKNTEGEASHIEYKKKQLLSARDRLFKPLLNLNA
jgi:uncharacterized protein (TIGR04562 family)